MKMTAHEEAFSTAHIIHNTNQKKKKMDVEMYKICNTNQKVNQEKKKMEREGENCDQKYKTIFIKIYNQWICNYNKIDILPKP